MPSENVDASRRLWDRFLAADTDGVLASLHPEIEVHEPPELPGASVYHGHQGWSDQLAKFREAIGEIQYRVVEHLDRGDDVITVVEASGVGAASGIAASMTYAEVETWREGKVISMKYFTSKEAAVEAAESP